MIDLLVGIGSAFLGVLQFLFNTVDGLLSFISIIPSASNFLGGTLSSVPPSIAGFFSVTILGTVFLFLIDRL